MQQSVNHQIQINQTIVHNSLETDIFVHTLYSTVQELIHTTGGPPYYQHGRHRT